MKTINSLSGGKTSAYIAANYPADYNIFALVRTNDNNCIYPDKKLRQVVSDKIGTEFIGTLEDDTIIHTMLDLEQYIGQKINWVTGKTFDEIIIRKDKKYLPNVTQRFCTSEMKLKPLFDWWHKNINEVVEMRIGFRANEGSRAKTMLSKTNQNGNLEFKTIVGKRKTQNKWKDIEWQKPNFPLIKDNIYKDKIELYWQDKDVRFAYMNNCIGCFHRSPILLKHMSDKHPNKFEWFINAEQETGYSGSLGMNKRSFKNGMSYNQIKNSLKQIKLFDDDFNECDSGSCGL
tara:strand:- start:11 stop:877 length:867 start_codon:yes stop_codon:yes gene_type:complete